MLSISSEYELSLNENSNQLIKAKITFADNTVRQLTGDDIVACDFDQQVSSDSSFDIGTAIIGQMTITLNNHDGRFDTCDFTKAQFIVWVGKQLSKGTEWIQRGVYTANQPDSYNGTIAISALDNMSKFEKPFRTFLASVGALQGANASVRTLLTDMCRHCGVTWADGGDKAFDTKFEYGYVDSNATCRQALAYACQALCVNASITNDGRLRTVWYDSAPFEAESDLDGGQFDSAKPYATGASKDGGNFTDYSSGASADGGTFFTNRNVHRLYAFSNITVNTDDVVITGVRVTERSVTVGSKTTNGGTYTVGTEGYVLDVSNNPLIIPGTGKSVADRIGAKVIGLRFRPFSGKHICVPSLEAGDCAYVIDRKQNVYKTYVTRVKYSVNGGMTVSCGAKSASRNSADNAGASTSAVVRARNELHQELGIRDETIKNLGESLANASGLYHTEAKQPDGSTVYYLHDKPTTGQSKIIYKVTASGIGISTDAGKTYATGLSADGNAVLNRIYAIGINADYLTTGRISSKNGNSFIDLDTEEANLKLGNKSTVGGKVIATTDVAASKTVTKYATSTSSTTAPTSGWQDSCPPRKAGSYIWFKIITVMQSGAQIESMPSCISGADGKDGAAGSRGPAGPAGVNGTNGTNGKDGRGIKSSVPEYYLSTTPSAVTGGSWSTSVPAWSSGKYYWQRLHITWSDGGTSYTDPVFNSALTSANQNAKTAVDTVNGLDQKKVFNLLTDNGKIKGLFTQDGQLFVNADYIGSGSIDAKRVAIRNLLSIGDDTNSVSVSSSGISFMSGGVKDALTIKPKSYKMVTVSKSGYNGSPIWEATGVASDPKTYGFDCTEKAQAFTYAGKTRVSIGVRVDFYANGYRHILGGRYDPLEYEIDTSKDTQSFTVQSQPFIVAFTLKKSSEAGSNGLPCYTISVSLVLIANGVHVCINGIDVFYSSPGYGGEISQKSTGAFLNRENFVKEVTDSFPLTCQVRIPVAMNNIIRDYVLTFEKGLLVGWDYYTPADSQYKGY
ncbi:collagen-like protein [Collinsella aerofaciens]|uniref:collagen-like triple helix repeat-containing protein n=1 Tax=Collinsella aerofaciens TaxID=74426 RepID=UPI00232AD75B|nr:collagen-like protein [Collinsella aerofaciens]MDB1905841.1 collagen-like protein [Collinsella aerofaciens]